MAIHFKQRQSPLIATLMKFRLPYPKVWFITVSAACLFCTASAHAVTTLSQGFTAEDAVRIGSIVSLLNNSSDQVDASSDSNVQDILGVVIDNNNTLLTLTSSSTTQVQVATSGVVQVLVSSINGDISQGDDITASPISGVGMKATIDTRVVGVAQQALNKTNGSTQTYTDKTGSHSVLIGEIPVLVNVSYFYKQPQKTVIPAALQNIANSIAGKSVSSLPILVSIGIFIVTIIVVVSIIYSMIHSSIISVGRNPMSQAAIYRNIIQLSLLVIGILAVGIGAIYMVLTKL